MKSTMEDKDRVISTSERSEWTLLSFPEQQTEILLSYEQDNKVEAGTRDVIIPDREEGAGRVYDVENEYSTTNRIQSENLSSQGENIPREELVYSNVPYAEGELAVDEQLESNVSLASGVLGIQPAEVDDEKTFEFQMLIGSPSQPIFRKNKEILISLMIDTKNKPELRGEEFLIIIEPDDFDIVEGASEIPVTIYTTDSAPEYVLKLRKQHPDEPVKDRYISIIVYHKNLPILATKYDLFKRREVAVNHVGNRRFDPFTSKDD